MLDPGVFAQNVEMGLSGYAGAEIPWWVSYFSIADRCHCQPWDLIDDHTPREFWVEAAAILIRAEQAVAQRKQPMGGPTPNALPEGVIPIRAAR